MKKLNFTVIVMTFFAVSCTVSYTDTGRDVNVKEDKAEMQLALKSLRFIKENKRDSLIALLNDDVRNQTKPEQLDWLLIQGQNVMKKNTYPADSLIKVSYQREKTIAGEITYKEFRFPFYNEDSPDSSMYFKIVVSNNEIHTLLLTSGVRFVESKFRLRELFCLLTAHPRYNLVRNYIYDV